MRGTQAVETTGVLPSGGAIDAEPDPVHLLVIDAAPAPEVPDRRVAVDRAPAAAPELGLGLVLAQVRDLGGIRLIGGIPANRTGARRRIVPRQRRSLPRCASSFCQSKTERAVLRARSSKAAAPIPYLARVASSSNGRNAIG